MKKINAFFLSILLIFCILPALPAKAASSPDSFVRASGTEFTVDGHPFYFAGANAYDLFTYGDGANYSDPKDIENKFMDKAKIDALMQQMEEDGVSVVRTWAFSTDSWHGFEPSKGKYNNSEYMELDYILCSAKAHHIKVILTLENNWDDYGGISRKLQWEGLPGGTDTAKTAFFRNEMCKEHYKEEANHIVNRINHYTGIAYKDDPTIFAWDLMNEARYQNAPVDENKTGYTLRKWVDEMGSYIKGLEYNHMVCIGIEGQESKYNYGGDNGCPFVYIQQSPYIDFCTAHPYPDTSWAKMTPAQTTTLVKAWIHDAHTLVKKPFVIGEFNSLHNRDQYWPAVFGTVEKENAAGGLFWDYSNRMLSDGYTILHGDPILTYFKQFSDEMAAKNKPGSPIDHQPPTAPGNLSASHVTDSSADLSWNASQDNVGVAAYDIYNGTAIVGTTASATNYTVTGLSPSTGYSFTVKARDAAENVSSPSNTARVTTAPAPQKPTAPADLKCTAKTDTTISLSWLPSTGREKIVSYEIYCNRRLTASSPSTSCTVTGLSPNTAYRFTVKAKDAAGNISPSSNAIGVTTNAPQYPSWDRSKQYVGGEIVSWKGTLWKAQWWTNHEEPGTTGQWGVWREYHA